VAVDVDYFGRSLLYDTLLVRAVEVHVPVQPEGRLVPVDEIHERPEADVGHILRIAEAERRRVSDEDPGFRTADEAPATDPDRERPDPAAHLALRVLVGTARVKGRTGEPGEHHAAFLLHDPPVERCAAARVLGALRAGVVVPEDVVDGDAEKGDDVLEVIEGQIPAGDHRFDPSRIRGQIRAVEHWLHLVADAEYLHEQLPITPQSITDKIATTGPHIIVSRLIVDHAGGANLGRTGDAQADGRRGDPLRERSGPRPSWQRALRGPMGAAGGLRRGG
jgi:hypothetical protein